MKRFLAIVLAICATAILLAGCGAQSSDNTAASTAATTTADQSAASTSAPAAQIIPFKFVLPGGPTKDDALVTAEVNKRMAADGVGIELQRTFIPWDAWQQKLNVMLSTGEEFDMFHVMQDQVPFANYMAMGAIQDITSVVKQYGTNFSNVLPDSIWSAVTQNGQILAIPTYWTELASFTGWQARMDVLNKYNLQSPKSIDEMIADYKIAAKDWKGKSKPYIPVNPSIVADTAVLRTLDSWPFAVQNDFIYVDQSGNVKSWIETPEFKQYVQIWRKIYQAGMLNPDILTVQMEQLLAGIKTGDFIYAAGVYDVRDIQVNNPAATPDDIQFMDWAPGKQALRNITVKNCNAVPKSSQHPESAVKFLNWLWANQDNYDLYFYGISGTHFNPLPDRQKETILDPNNNNQPDYNDSDWMTGNINFIRYNNKEQFPSTNNQLYHVNTDAVNSVAADFLFDPTNVKAEYANLETEAKTCIEPLMMGVLDYDKAFPAALDKMKKAGLDKVVAEYKKQFDAWRAAGGK